MTVGELKELFDQMDPDTEVRLAMQPAWPFEYSINDYAIIDTSEEEDFAKDDGKSVLYLTEGRQIGYLPKQVCDEIGW